MSICIEIDDKEALRQAVRKEMLPDGARVMGYPGIVDDVARRALETLQAGGGSGSGR